MLLVCVLLVHLLVCFLRVSFCHFSLPLWGWLRVVIVALPGFFYKLLCNSVTFKFWVTLEYSRHHGNLKPKRFDFCIE